MDPRTAATLAVLGLVLALAVLAFALSLRAELVADCPVCGKPFGGSCGCLDDLHAP